MQRLLRERIETNQADARGILLPREVKVLRKAIEDVDRHFSIRTLSALPVSFAVSDAGAVILFEDSLGRVDFNFALAGTDEASSAWTRELFLHLWAGAAPPR
jgi:predicted transcriptional regulator